MFGDGHIHDYIEILSPLEGDYSIQVIPDIGTDPSETFSLESWFNSNYYYGFEKYLARDMMLRDIPTSGFSVSIAQTPEPTSILFLGLGLFGILPLKRRMILNK